MAILGFQAAATASGARFLVDSTADVVDARAGDGSCATRFGSCTLRAAIQEANALPGTDLIDVHAGTYEIAIPPLNQNDVTTGDLDITDSVVISGTGMGATVIDGGVPLPGSPPDVHGLDRIFEVAVDGGEVAFSGLTLQDGYAAEYGGAIANSLAARVTVAASVLTRNVAEKAGGAIDNHAGGAVEVRGSTVSGNFAYENGSAINNNRNGSLTVIDSTVAHNSASAIELDETLAGAGAISNNAELDTAGTITVIGSDITGNRAGGGRAGASISNDGAGTVTVADTTFSRNVATGDGGAIFNDSGEVVVDESTFAENGAQDGGAIYNAARQGSTTVRDSSFSLNSAAGRGGAILSEGTGVLTVLDGEFTKNSADEWGGAILNDDKGSATIADSTFRENSGLNGGAFANEGTGLVTVENSTFIKNSAIAGVILASGEGGGMHSNSVGDVVINGGAFTDNTARGGGGLSNEGGGTLAVTGTSFTDNNAEESGGGILIESGAVRMVDVEVSGNFAASPLEGGGGISYAGDKLVAVGESAGIEASRIFDNETAGPGGGIDSRGDGPLVITTTSVTGNKALTGGGIHHVGDAPVALTRSTLSGNTAVDGGGLLTDGDGTATIENSTVSANRAGRFGGGLLASSSLVLSSSTVATNTAASGGGIHNGGGDPIGDGSVSLRNTIVAASATGGNCAGTMTSLGGNLEDADTCRLRELSDQPGTDPRLGPLADNGGPTQTHALLAGSPAQEAASCTELEPCASLDQRGVLRPLFERVDAGAYESEIAPGGGGGQACAGDMERPVRADFDSWVSQSAASSNFGFDATLKVESKPGANDRALVHFTLPPVPPGCELVGATLRLRSPSATEGHTLEARRLASGWTEAGVNWANQPATAGPVTTAQSGIGFVEWDVLAQAREMYALGSHGFLLRDRDENGSGEQSFHSREKVDDPPELLLRFNDPDGPPQPGDCPTNPQSVAADRDSWINQGSPTNNFGNDSTLKVKTQVLNNARTLVHFPLPALPAGCTGIASATLGMEASSAKDGRTLEALQLAVPWVESTVTWNNRPATTGAAATVPSAEGPLAWEVTEQLLGMYTSANHGFLIRDSAEDSTAGEEQTLNSRDKLGDGPPELVIVFDDGTPETTITSGPDPVTAARSATFVFGSESPDATFECSLDDGDFDACTSPHVLTDLAGGDHSFEVRAKRPIRAVDPTPARYDWTIRVDTTGPETTITGRAGKTFQFTSEPGATFECRVNTAAFAGCTSPHTASVGDGTHTFEVRATDSAGNTGPATSRAFTIDTTGPETTITGRDGTTFEFTSEPGATFECRVNTAAFAACTSPHTVTIVDGDHTFQVRASDSAGNTGPTASRAFTIDTTGPITTITGRDGKTFQFTSEPGATFECRVNTAAFAACTSPHTVTVPDGDHTFEVRATDTAGNTGPVASSAFTIDTTGPVATINGGPNALTNDATPTFAFSSEGGVTFQCRVGNAAFGECVSPHTTTTLGDGPHTFQVRAADAAGNFGPAASYSFSVDTTPPQTTINGAGGLTSDPTPAFAFSSEAGVTFQCRVDNGSFSDCSSPHTTAMLSDDSHTFEVRATDAAGNTGLAATHTFTVDTTGPVTTIDSGPTGPASTFEFSSELGATFECRLGNGTFASCTSPHSVNAGDGDHTFHVRAVDQAGNTGPAATRTFTVDTIPPVATIDEGPKGLTLDSTPTFVFSSENGASFRCRVDNAAFEACNSPHTTTALTDGPHTFDVRATDAAGNNGAAASYAFTVDTTPPQTTMLSPGGLTNDSTPAFAFTSEQGASFQCGVDDSPFSGCASPYTTAALTDGLHTFEVRATDLAGNTGPAASRTITVDTTAPQTTISGTGGLTNDPTPAFAFTSEQGASFQCRVDDSPFSDCASPHTTATLTDGSHTFEVRATDQAGNPGPAASRSFTVDTTPPQVTLTGPSGPAPTFEFSSDESASFECRVDDGAFGSCTSPHSVTVADGTYTFEVRATDLAGNTGPAAGRTFTVDTSGPPETALTEKPDVLSNDSSATLGFSGSTDTVRFECRLDDADFADCDSPAVFDGLGEGAHAFEVRAVDDAGNLDPTPASHSWTVDTTAPVATIVQGPSGPTGDATPSFVFSTEPGASLECRVATSAFTPCTAPYTTAELGDGSHTFEVRATDQADNTGPAAGRAFTVDTTAPDTAITAGPAEGATVTDTAATFAFSGEDAATFECSLDGAAFAACSSPAEYTGLGLGAHTFAVGAKDGVGNVDGSPAQRSWIVAAPPAGGGGGSGADQGTIVTPPPPVSTTDPPQIRVKLAYAADARRRATTFRSLRIKGVPAGATVRVSCKGDSCPRKSLTIASPAGGVVKLKPFLDKRLRPGTKLTITVAKPGMTGDVIVVKIRAGRPPRVT